MKKFLLPLLAVLIASPSFAVIKGAPFIPEVDKRFDAIEGSNLSVQSSLTSIANMGNGNNYMRYAKATYDVVASGGTAASYNLGVALPANSLIKTGYIYFVNQLVKSGSPTLALVCGAATLKTAGDYSANAAGSIIALNQTGTATGAATDILKGPTSSCNLTATVASGTLTAGKIEVFVEYYQY